MNMAAHNKSHRDLILRHKRHYYINIASFPLTTILYGSTYWKVSE